MSFRVFVLLLPFFLLFAACQNDSDHKYRGKPKVQEENQDLLQNKNYTTPTEELVPLEFPFFEDDLDFEGLELAIVRQLNRYKNKNLSGTIKLGTEKFPLERVRDTLIAFGGRVASYKLCKASSTNPALCINKFNESIKRDFLVFRPSLEKGDKGFGKEDPVFFTAYYTPTIEAKLQPEGEFVHPIFARPQAANLRGKTRVEIDFKGALKGKGLELFYTKDLFELYLLHVQGGGKIIVNTEKGMKKEFYISYDGTNKRKFRMISIYMHNEGYISDKSIDAQRDFLIQNPHKQEEIYDYCPSYVYFKITDTPPEGNDSVALTDNRSIATDRNYYSFKGMLSFVSALRPEKVKSRKMIEYSRFYLDQDTGGAIKGKARVDLYQGEGRYAEHTAYNTAINGKLFFLMIKPGVVFGNPDEY